MKNWAFAFVISLAASLLTAQSSGIELGVLLGPSTYQGDVTNNPFWELKQTSIGVGAFARFAIEDTWVVRTGINYVRISGDDFDNSDRDGRAFSFFNNMVEMTVLGEWEPWGGNRASGTLKVSPYIVGGAGLLYTNPKVDFSQFTGDLLTRNVIRDRDTPYSKLRVVIPAGLGVKFPFGEQWVLSLEATARYPFTDFLDGISYSANSDKNDWYALIGVTVAKRL